MKLKMQLSLSPTEKYLHTIKSNKDMEVTFNKYIIGMTHVIMIYMEREKKYIL